MDAETSTAEIPTQEKNEEGEKGFSYFDILDKPRDLPEPVNLTFQHLKEVGYDLGLIDLCWPEEIKPIFEDRTNFPIRYVSNTEKEKTLLLYTKNFRKKFMFMYPDRKQLFLGRDNECGILKMVCTTIRPTALPYPVFEVWDTSAYFIADHIKLEILENPRKLPNHLYSPHTTLLRQSGTCFECATVLCSILLGVGYDAYVVSGYADKDISLRILVRVDCPFPPFKEEEEKPPEPPKIEKYAIMPPNGYQSKFIKMMEQREIDKLFKQDLQQAEAERLRLMEEEKPPFDELKGQRIHAWILVKAGAKDIQEDFFIEPTTGTPYPLSSTKYFGIESIWNHQNYWVNLQDCSQGLDKIDYNFTCNDKWIHLLAAEPFGLRIQKPKDLGDEELNRDMYIERHLDMPVSWSLRLHISQSRLEKRFPDGGFRETNYKRVIVEQYAPFVSVTGMTQKITRYRDFYCKDPFVVEEEYKNRHDKFFRRVYNCVTNIITDYFGRGRLDSLNKHIYTQDDFDFHAHRIMFFDSSNRSDYLYKLEVDGDKITEEFRERPDNLIHKQTTYTKEDEEKKNKAGYTREIWTVVEKYKRNDSKPSFEDISIREFDIVSREIRIKYHYGKNNITASTRVFEKPAITEWGQDLDFTVDLTYGYQAEVGVKPFRQVELYQMFHQHLAAENASLVAFREIENYLTTFLSEKIKESPSAQLDVPIFNREQNVKYKIQMQQKSQHHKVIKGKSGYEKIDYLAPYVVMYRRPLTLQQAQTAKDKCIQEYKDLMVNRANRLFEQYSDLDTKLQEMKSHYAQEHDNMTQYEESDYIAKVHEVMTVMKAIQIRTNRHQQLTVNRFIEFEAYLDSHPLLQILKRQKKRTFSNIPRN